MTARVSIHRANPAIGAILAVAVAAAASAQTKIEPPSNRYSVQEDVKLGQEAAAEVRKELPLISDERVDTWVEGIGARLVAAIPGEFQHPEFKYTFDVINQKEINAFALPGGPMFLNRGMIEAAKTEAEVAGVMAHEISHVALRHGTAQASKATTPGILGTLGQIIGQSIGGIGGAAIGIASQVGAGAWITKYSREYETQADILGAQILARAGYNPAEMANMFKTIEAEGGGGGGPEWLSSHPNPGNRYERIINEAKSLQVQGNADTGQLAAMQARLKELGPAYTAEEIAKGKAKTGNTPTTANRTVRVDPPARSWRTERPADFLQVSLPSNWSKAGTGATYGPEGAFFEQNGQTAFTHGVQFGTARGSGNLQRDTQDLLNSFARGNPQLRQQGRARRDTLSGRNAISMQLTNVSDVTGQPELVMLTTTTLPDGTLFYVVGVAPQSEAQTYRSVFDRVRQSVRLATR